MLNITWQSVFNKVEFIVEHRIEIVHYKDAEGNIHKEYIPIEGEYADVESLKGTMLDWEELTRVPESWQGTHASIPFYRKKVAYLEDGFKTSRQTLINWMNKVGDHLKNVLLHLKSAALVKNAIVNCDETWCRVRLDNKKQRKGYIWCLINKAAKIVIFFFDKGSRGRKVLTEFLGDADIKALQSDAYNAYYYLDDKECGIEHLCCLEHARAKFYESWIRVSVKRQNSSSKR